MAKIFTLKFDSLTGAFDDGPLQEFLTHKEVLSLREHFFVKDEIPYLTIVAHYTMPPLTTPGGNVKEGESWRTMLTENDISLFNTLRTWRQKKARDSGVPPYIICTNAQLAAIACRRSHSLNALSLIEGIGRAKIEKYGRELLQITSNSSAHCLTAVSTESPSESGTPQAGEQ